MYLSANCCWSFQGLLIQSGLLGLRGLILFFCAWLLLGCGGKKGVLQDIQDSQEVNGSTIQIDDSGNGIAGITPPNKLRNSSSVKGPVLKGSDFSTVLTSANVQTSSTELIMTPNGVSLKDDGVAYAIWAIDTADIQPNGTVLIDWSRGSGTGDFWVGIADFAANTWRWNNTANSFDPVSFEVDDCIRGDGAAFIVLVATGNHPIIVSNIFMTVDSEGPLLVAVINSAGAVGQNVQLQSINIGAEATQWVWLFGGSCEPPTSTEMNPEVNLGEEGIYDCQVTGYNDKGSSTYGFNMEVFDWNTGIIHEMPSNVERWVANIDCDGLGRPHVVGRSNNGWITYIHWNGNNWELEQVLDTGIHEYDDPVIAVSPSGKPHIAYLDEYLNVIQYLTKEDSGWVTETVGQCYADEADFGIAVDPSGVVHLCYTTQEEIGGPRYQLKYVVRDSGGWRQEDSFYLDESSRLPNLELDSLGRPHIVWLSQLDVKYAWYDGSFWNEEVVYSGRVKELLFELSPTDSPILAFHEYQYQPDHDVCWHAKREAGSWVIDLVSKGDEEVYQLIALAVDSTGSSHLLYSGFVDLPETSLRISYLQGDGKVWQNIGLPNDELIKIFYDMTLDIFDRPHFIGRTFNQRGEIAGFHSSIGNNINYAPKGMEITRSELHKNSLANFSPVYACGASDYSWDFGGAGGPSFSSDRYPQIEMNGPGTYDCSYTLTNEFGSDTYYFQVEVDDWVQELIEDVEVQTAIFHAIDSAGHPHICYQAKGIDEFHYAYHNGASWEIEVLVEGFFAGYHCDIEVDSNDLPHIMYTNSSSPPDLFYIYRDELGWHDELVYSDLGSTTEKEFNLNLNSLNQPSIAFWDRKPSTEHQESDLNYGKRVNDTWVFSKVLTDLNSGYEVSMDLDSNDMPHLVFSTKEDTGGTGFPIVYLKYAKLEGANWIIYTVAESVDFGGWGSLTLDSLDRPFGSYYEHSNFGFNYAWFDGSSWQFENAGLDTASSGTIIFDQYDTLHAITSKFTHSGPSKLLYARLDGPGTGWYEKTICGYISGNSSLEVDGLGIPSIVLSIDEFNMTSTGDPFFIYFDP